MFTVVSAEVVARKLIKENEKVRKLVKIKNYIIKFTENLRPYAPTGVMRFDDECFQCLISSYRVKGKLF